MSDALVGILGNYIIGLGLDYLSSNEKNITNFVLKKAKNFADKLGVPPAATEFIKDRIVPSVEAFVRHGPAHLRATEKKLPFLRGGPSSIPAKDPTPLAIMPSRYNRDKTLSGGMATGGENEMVDVSPAVGGKKPAKKIVRDTTKIGQQPAKAKAKAKEPKKKQTRAPRKAVSPAEPKVETKNAPKGRAKKSVQSRIKTVI